MDRIGTVLWAVDAKSSLTASRRAENGTLRKLHRGLFASDMITDPAVLCRRDVWNLIDHYLPGAMIADRTAMLCAPSPDGSVFLVHDTDRELILPGLRIVARRGPVLETDKQFLRNLRISGTARMLLDNLKPGRSRKGAARTTGQLAVEEWIEKRLHQGGNTDELLLLRQEALNIHLLLDREEEFRKLNGIIGAFRGTAPSGTTTGKSGAVSARIRGEPFDRNRIDMFRELRDYLNSRPSFYVSNTALSETAWLNISFFDAYFSNFIEGTEFEVDEAFNIIYNGTIPDFQKADAHDILGTYAVCSDPDAMMPADTGYDKFTQNLRSRHRSIMQARTDKRPRILKHIGNHVGGHYFVSPEEVTGTLREVYGMLQDVRGGFSRAVFLHAALAEIHPFLDGNGRISRIFMNGELTGRSLSRIIIPTVFRNNYLEALRAFTSGNGMDQIYEVMQYIQEWTALIPWADFTAARSVMEQVNAFRRPETSFRLRKPSEDEVAEAVRMSAAGKPGF